MVYPDSSAITDQQNNQCQHNNISSNQTENEVRRSDNVDSNRSLKADNIIPRPPTSLLSQRHESVQLFAKPTATQDHNITEKNGAKECDRMNTKTTIHHREGDFEIDYEAGSIATSKHAITGKLEHFIDGDFHNGKVRDIETEKFCYNIQFNLDSSILAIGLDNNGGVLLYETKHFSLFTTIERNDTVSALDWVENPFNNVDDSLDQLLAVGGFDGDISIYSVVIGSPTKMLYNARVKSDVLSMKFIKDAATNYVPYPLALMVGEKNGNVSFFFPNGKPTFLNSSTTMKKIDSHDSAVLAVAFGFIKDGILMATGTKNGLLRVSLVIFHLGEWTISHLLFHYSRAGAIRALRFNHDSTSLIVGGYDKTVLIVDTKLWKVVREIFVDGTVLTIEFDPYHRYLMLGTRSKLLTVIDTSTYHKIKTIHTNGWVTCISWGGDSMIAMRSDDKMVSLMKFEPIQSLDIILESSRGEECCLSWSYDGRFLSRTYGNEVIINDSKKDFEEVCRLGQKDAVRGVKFCLADGKRDRIATVGSDGFLRIFQLRISLGNVHVEALAAVYLEPNLWAVSWSSDGECIMAGGKGALLYFIDGNNYQPLCKPKKTGGRINSIATLCERAQLDLGDYSLTFSTAITMGQNYVEVYDMSSYNVSMKITRKRAVRCISYHPSLPIMAIGDGSNEIIIVDLVGERRIASFFVNGRVNTIEFSPFGDFIVVGSDDCIFTIHEVTTFKVIQEIPAKGFAMSVAFSGTSGQYLALGHANGETDIIQLGPLLSIDYISLTDLHALPSWAFEEAIYRSPQGPSFLQRCMFEGSKESLMCAAMVLKQAPNSVLTFDRTTGVGCFEIAVKLMKPNIMQLILTTLVDGTLETQNELSSSLLTTTMPIDGFLTLRDLILHHPPGYATDILRSMTFVKVPFVSPLRVRSDEIKECGSPNYTNPWTEDKLKSSSEHLDGRDHEILVPAVLPLPGLGTLDFLSALICHTGPDVFDNDAMGLVLLVMWESGVRNYFLIDFSINVIFYITWVFFVDRTSSNTMSENNPIWFVTLTTWITFCMNCFFIIEQIIRIVGRRGKRFRSTWHYVDIITTILVFIYTIFVITQDMDDGSYFMMDNSGKGNVPLGVIATLFLTARFISLLRGFDRTGWLVAVLTQNLLDVRGFIIVIVCILFGFTVAFRILLANVNGQCMAVLDDGDQLSNDCDRDPFSNLARSFISTFELTILGSYEPAMFYENDHTTLSLIMFVIAVTIVLVIALNALIAVLGDSFSRVQENVTANRRRERAELIVEYLSMMPTRQRKKIEQNNQYFHALLASDGHGDLLINKEDWQGGLHALKRELTDLTEMNNQRTHQTIVQLKEELKQEVAIMMRNEVGAMLNDIFLEVKEISKSQYAGQISQDKKVLNDDQMIQNNFLPRYNNMNVAQFGGIINEFLKPIPLKRQRELNHSSKDVKEEQEKGQEDVNSLYISDDDEDESSTSG